MNVEINTYYLQVIDDILDVYSDVVYSIDMAYAYSEQVFVIETGIKIEHKYPSAINSRTDARRDNKAKWFEPGGV